MDVAMVALAEGVPEGEVHSSPMAAETVDHPVPGPGKEQYEEEIDSLVRFFNEEEALQVVVRYRKDRETPGNIQRKKIAKFLEGSRLPFSAVVKDIFERLNDENDQDQSKNGAVTMASVKSSVLSLGERLSFGVTWPDADVLEDDTPGSLWCWEVRDVKLLSKVFRDEILDRRRCRKKIGERITAVSATLNALRSASLAAGQGEIEQRAACLQAQREALVKVDDESAIRASKVMWPEKKCFGVSPATNSNPLGEQPNNLTQEALSNRRRKSDPEEKERIRQEKVLKREQMESEKEQKRKEKEEADRKKQQLKQQDEAEKEQKRKEKEEVERKKQERKLQDEAEKEQKREAERKKQLALKKQASFMDKFLVRKDPLKDSAKSQQAGCGQTQEQAQPQIVLSASPVAELQKREFATPSGQSQTVVVVARMDEELKGCDVPIGSEELLRSHVHNWLRIRTQSASRTYQRWGVRRKPKAFVYRELRLTGTVGDSRGNSHDDGQVRKGAANSNSSPVSNLKRMREEFDSPGLDGDWKENVVECLSPTSPLEDGKKSATSRYHQLRNKKRKLLQFDKGHRPPYYGTFSKKSEYIKPRHPLKQDPALDYEVDSDEEWEEEDPGESLSDAEKDEEDEKGEIEEIEDDEDGPDEFVVPDGYLSEEEGVAIEHSERNFASAGGSSATDSPVTPVSQSVMSLERLRKVLDNATEHAIRSNHPLVISNLGQLPGCEEDTSAKQFPSNRTETLCLEALRMRVLVPNLLIGAC